MLIKAKSQNQNAKNQSSNAGIILLLPMCPGGNQNVLPGRPAT